MPYNYVVGHDNSTKLEDAPEPIKEAVHRMTWAAKRIVPEEDFVAFNELLAIGYLEAMRMGVRAIFQSQITRAIFSLMTCSGTTTAKTLLVRP